MTLVEFLHARIEEDERAARDGNDAADGSHEGGESWELSASAEYLTVYVSHARVLAECEAKRRIIELHQAEDGQHPDFCGHDLREIPCLTLRSLALPYAEHADYHEAWRP